MAPESNVYTFVAIIPQTGFITVENGPCRENICYIRFGDTVDFETTLEQAAQNPAILSIPRKIRNDITYPNSNVRAGTWLQKAVLEDRGFEHVPARNGSATPWFKIYLRPGQLVNIHTFLSSWEVGYWNLETQAGQTAIYNYLVNDVLLQDSNLSFCAGRGGYNSTEKEERRDSAFD